MLVVTPYVYMRNIEEFLSQPLLIKKEGMNRIVVTNQMIISTWILAHMLKMAMLLSNVIVSASSTAEPIYCGKPAMTSTVPLYCPVHFDKAEKLTARALRNAGLNASSSKPAPKLHAIIPEYVRQIQHKRRAAQKAQKSHKAQKTNLGIAEVRERKNV